MKFERTKVYNFEEAFYGMRLPMNSHHKSDSCQKPYGYDIGDNDLALAQKLIRGGSEHRKFLRQILVSVTITAPIYWWKEFDTYKVGVTANSTSTMHKLKDNPITLGCFETDDFSEDLQEVRQADYVITWLEALRKKYMETNDKRYWKELVRWLPSSWLQTRTVTMNYENIRNMYFQRKNHKLAEWSVSFIDWVQSLPYSIELIMYEGAK